MTPRESGLALAVLDSLEVASRFQDAWNQLTIALAARGLELRQPPFQSDLVMYDDFRRTLAAELRVPGFAASLEFRLELELAVRGVADAVGRLTVVAMLLPATYSAGGVSGYPAVLLLESFPHPNWTRRDRAAEKLAAAFASEMAPLPDDWAAKAVGEIEDLLAS